MAECKIKSQDQEPKTLFSPNTTFELNMSVRSHERQQYQTVKDPIAKKEFDQNFLSVENLRNRLNKKLVGQLEQKHWALKN